MFINTFNDSLLYDYQINKSMSTNIGYNKKH